MFRKKHVVVEIPEEVQTALASLDSETKALAALVSELVARQEIVLDALRHTIAANGVEVEEPVTTPEPVVEAENDIPATMTRQTFDDTSEGDLNRVRSSPFTRVPRHRQAAWLRGVLGDNAWHNSLALARHYANDDRHFRYLKHAIAGRLREMHEEGILDRRASDQKGVMFEYRLKQGL